jgi:hypothetical protein
MMNTPTIAVNRVDNGPMRECEAREIIAALSAHFSVPEAYLQWVPWSKNGRYLTHSKRIQCGPNCWRGAVPALLHEFAHHLHHVRNGHDLRFDKNGNRWHDHHGRRFMECLADVVVAYYSDISLYPWHTEYRSIRSFAVARGFNQPKGGSSRAA